MKDFMAINLNARLTITAQSEGAATHALSNEARHCLLLDMEQALNAKPPLLLTVDGQTYSVLVRTHIFPGDQR